MAKKQHSTKAKTAKRKPQGKKKATYRVKNWAAYNKSLAQRESITLWISEDVLANWHPKPEGVRSRGGQMRYSDQAITCLLMLKAVNTCRIDKRSGLVSR